MEPDDERPMVADRYRLDDVIGSGGVGRVWRGEDTVLRRPVAVKEVPLPLHLDGEERDVLRARVLREARAAARIHHPGSVSVFDVVDAGDTVYVVMELVEDRTLADVVAAEGPLSPAATAAMGAELLGALAAAHAVGIVHRDVKPRNVMVVGSGGVKLADFGIASVRDDPGLTRTGMVLGTPSYMAPEQALGQPVGPAADLWGTGALLYFAVEGVAPFDRGEPLATLHAVVHEPPRPFERAGPVGPVLAELLAKDPDARPPLEEVRARLASVAAAEGQDGRTIVLPATRVATPPPAVAAAGVAAPPERPVTRPRVAGAAPRRAGPDRRGALLVLLAALAAIVVAGGIALAANDDDAADDQAQGATADPTSTEATVTDDATTAPPTTAPATSAAPTTAPATTTTTAPADGDEDGGSDGNGRDDSGDDGNGGGDDGNGGDGSGDDGNGGGDDGNGGGDDGNGGGREGGSRPEGVPGSWVSYSDPDTGWSIWHPAGWQPTPAPGNATDIRDPATGDYVRVDSVARAGSDPVAAWRESSARFAARYPDYRELRIEPTTFKGHDAALWEYTYQGRRATNLGIVTSGPGYALNFQTAASRWNDRAELRRAFEAGFTIPD